jgi:cytochrome P450
MIPDVFSEEWLLNPFPWYQAMREYSPVFHDEINQFWSVFCYDDVQRVLSDYEHFSSQSQETVVPSADQPFASSMLSMDPPRHNQLRALVTQAFTPRAVDALAPRIAQIVDDLISPLLASGEMNVVRDLATPLPVIVIAELLGIPTEDRAKFKTWSDIVVGLSNGEEAGRVQSHQAAIAEMRDYFTEMISRRREEPGDDLISGLLTASVDGQGLSLAELFGFGALLLVAGNVTTTNLISSAVLTFSEHPEVWQRIQAEPGLIPQTVEEVLRYRPPVRSIIRVTKTDAEVGGRQIPRGSAVISWIGSANRDASRFPDPERFDIDRSPNRHLSFGQGIHYCLGAPLARLEARIAIQGLVDRIASLEVVPGTHLKPVSSFILYGLEDLPITFSVR